MGKIISSSIVWIMKRFKVIFISIMITLAGFASGAAIAYWHLKNQGMAFQINNNGWTTSTDIGSEKETLFLKAYVALNFLFALPQSEVIYFIANTDSEGNPLVSTEDYIITGNKLPARYWSITMYAEDHFLVANEENRFGFNLDNIQYEKDKSYILTVSANKKEKNWLPAPLEGRFKLGLRLYNLEKGMLDKLGEMELPKIRKIKK